MRRGWTALVAILPVLAFACAWDSDTLAQEAKGLPGVVETLTGRVDINPPLYYEMRLARVTQHKPMTLADYDDAAVACDKLGRFDEAIAWMDKKKALLDKHPDKEHLYRYHANIGTFYAHKWLKTKDASNKTLLEKSISALESAITINPDAHFGREPVQLGLIKLIHAQKNGNVDYAHPAHAEWVEMTRSLGQDKVRKGLTGLMVMGTSFESIDVVRLLGSVNPSAASIIGLSKLRAEDLKARGHKSIFDDRTLDSLARSTSSLSDSGSVEQAWKELSDQGSRYRKRRTDFMMARLSRGSHPDTDPDFWKGYAEVPKTNLEKYQSLARFANNPNSWLGLLLKGLGTLFASY